MFWIIAYNMLSYTRCIQVVDECYYISSACHCQWHVIFIIWTLHCNVMSVRIGLLMLQPDWFQFQSVWITILFSIIWTDTSYMYLLLPWRFKVLFSGLSKCSIHISWSAAFYLLYYVYCRIAHEILVCLFNVQSNYFRSYCNTFELSKKNFKCFPISLFKLHYNVYKRKFGAELSPWSYLYSCVCCCSMTP